MFKKITLFLVVLIVAVGMLAGCGSSPLKSGYGDFLTDKEAIKKAAADMKVKGGEPLKLFQNVNVSTGYLRFVRQDQQKPENVDEFMWHENGGWKGPTPVKLRGDGDLEDNLYNFDQVNWEAIPDFVANAKKKALEEGVEKPQLDSILVYFNVREQKLSFSGTIKGERSDAAVSGDVQTGEVTYFKIR